MQRTLILLLLTFIIFSCNKESEVAEQMLANKEGYERIASRFLNQDYIKWISIAHEYDEYGCHTVNDWSNCPGTGTNGGTFEQGLRRNNIEINEYRLYHNFLLNQKLTNIKKAYGCDSCVELEFKTFGLRYSNEPHELTEDHEYLSVNKIDDKWYSYTRDWN
ncbi:MAG: hypothetical protein ABJ004_16785 [Cyclobacteriaceae bacterium]